MFKIYDGREKFYQWDLDRKLIVEDPQITEVHFCNRTGDCSLVCETFVEDGITMANVPNILLQTDWKIRVYAYDGTYTKHEECYEVVSRTKPADYIYTETEVLSYEHLENEIEQIREEMQQQGVLTEEQIVDINNIPFIEEEVSLARDDIGNLAMEFEALSDEVSEIGFDMSLKQAIVNVNYVGDEPEYVYSFGYTHNDDTRLEEAYTTSISFAFNNNVYVDDYISSLSFDSGEAPTRIDYINSGILNWVGTDCSDVDGYSIFKPEPNKHYDIVFYFNGRQFIGLVNGFVPSLGNVVA